MSSRWSSTTKRAVALSVIALALVVAVQGHEVIEPFLWAAIFAYVFGPLIGAAQRRTNLPRGLLVAGLFAGLALALYGVGRVLVPIVFAELGEVRRTVPSLLANAQQQVSDALSGTGYESLAATLIDDAQALTQRLSGMVVPVALGVLSSLVKLLIFVVALFYLLRDGPRMAGWLRTLLPQGHR